MIRVTGGSLRGRVLHSLPGLATRPPLAQVRQAVFNILGPRVCGARFLDLYAGTGSYSIEAISRGAAFCTLVEKSPRALKVIRANLESTGCAGQAELIPGEVLATLDRLARAGRCFDVVAVAPPHDAGLLDPTLAGLDAGNLLAPGGTVFVQHYPGEPVCPAAGRLCRYRQTRYGSTLVSWFRTPGELASGQ
ncbi:MAG: RsmD family RNA methyltransferase [Bacillota bacterium]